jgi:hypothetical protein
VLLQETTGESRRQDGGGPEAGAGPIGGSFDASREKTEH